MEEKNTRGTKEGTPKKKGREKKKTKKQYKSKISQMGHLPP